MTAPYIPGPGSVPPPAGPPAAKPKPTFWQTLPGALTIVGICVAILAALLLPKLINPGPAGNDLDVNLTSCSQDTVGVAHVGITVKNNSDTAVTAKVGIEYRDSSGARLDTDTAYLRSIAAGDMARTEEQTVLDATASGTITCKLTSAGVA